MGPVSTFGRELLRGRRRPIGLMVSFMIFTASVWKLLDQPMYVKKAKVLLKNGTRANIDHMEQFK